MIGNTYVVGLTGAAQSGKDTAVQSMLQFGELIADNVAVGQRYAFADQLKKFYAAARTLYVRRAGILAAFPTANAEQVYTSFMSALDANEMQRVMAFMKDLFDKDLELAKQPYRVESEDDKRIHRKNLIEVGMFFRTLRADFWMDMVRRQIMIDTETRWLPFAFISDVRFENERSVCDYVVRIHRPGTVPVMRDGKLDPSEVFAAEGYCDEIITNELGKADFQEKVVNLLFSLVRLRNWEHMLEEARGASK